MGYVETGNASEAYRRAYDVSDTAKPQGIWVEASRILANPNVSLRVVELQAAAAERAMVTVESLTQELEEARQLAIAEANPSAAVSAIMGKAKLHGLAIDRKELSGKPGSPVIAEQVVKLDDESARKLVKMLNELVS